MYNLVSPSERSRDLLPKLPIKLIRLDDTVSRKPEHIRSLILRGTHELAPIDSELKKLINAAIESQGPSSIGVDEDQNQKTLAALGEYFNQFYVINDFVTKPYVDINDIVMLSAVIGFYNRSGNEPMIMIAIRDIEGEDKGLVVNELVKKP